MFRLIALRPLEGCSENALKCLHTNETYYFCNLFEIAENGLVSWNKDKNHYPDEDLYQINGGPSKISMTAIVGKNGDGKSSIVELMMRLINNYAALTLHVIKDPGAIVPVKGVCAILYYIIDKSIYRLQDTAGEGNVKLEKIAVINEDHHEDHQIEMLIEPEDIYGHHQLAEHFFYTMVSNYSHYSYNVYDFRSEWVPAQGQNQTSDQRCWLYHIFHKNDGYRTPLVLNPYRSRGIIDINREAFLTQQRLISLFLDAETPGKDGASFREMYGKEASHIALEDPGYSKLQEKTIKEYFTWVKNDSLLDEIIRLTKRSSTNLLNDSTISIYADECLSLLEVIVNRWITPNISLLKAIKKWDKEEKEKNNITDGERGYLAKNSDLANWVIELKQANFEEKNEEKAQLLKIIEPYKDFNIAQLQRVGLINVVCKAIAGEYKGHQISREDCFKLTSHEVSLDYVKLNMRQKCEHYIIYKIISIFETYKQEYELPCRHFTTLIKTKRLSSKDKVLESIVKLWNDIKNSPSHITLKLRQTLYYRRNFLTRTSDKYVELDHESIAESQRINIILNRGREETEKINYLILPLDKLKNEIEDCHNLEQLPPPIYYSHVVFTSQDDDDKVMTMESLSSGEKQRLMTISGIIYHLRNINTIDNEGIRYHHVNIVLEEIELYFHPESQRVFIKELIEMIERANLRDIYHINVMFITHSPFVLSDILSDNVLMLEKGKRDKDKEPLKTFGANIYEMLDTGFFMEKGAIGGFATSHISNIVNHLNDWNERMKDHRKREPAISSDKLLRMIKIIDDRVIRESLLIRYDDVFGQGKSIDDEIIMLRNRIAMLEQKKRNHVETPEA